MLGRTSITADSAGLFSTESRSSQKSSVEPEHMLNKLQIAEQHLRVALFKWKWRTHHWINYLHVYTIFHKLAVLGSGHLKSDEINRITSHKLFYRVSNLWMPSIWFHGSVQCFLFLIAFQTFLLFIILPTSWISINSKSLFKKTMISYFHFSNVSSYYVFMSDMKICQKNKVNEIRG